jgi:hypothetical protein
MTFCAYLLSQVGKRNLHYGPEALVVSSEQFGIGKEAISVHNNNSFSVWGGDSRLRNLSA